jgi:hypothetical protein
MTTRTLLMDAHVACGGTRDEVCGFIIRKSDNVKHIYCVIDTLAADGPEMIFNGPKSECVIFVQGIIWGAKAGRSAFAASF